MSRVLSVQVRRFGVPGAALILLVGAVALYLVRGEWAVGWMALAMTQRSYLMLLCPLALAVGAWLAHRERRANVAELFAGTPRPAHQRALLTLTAVGGAAGLAYLLVLAVTAPWIAATARYLPATVFGVVTVGVLAVVASAWIGLAVGRLVPRPVTAPALAVVGFLAVLALPLGLEKQWLASLSSPAWAMDLLSDYQTVPGEVSAAQAILAIGVATAAAIVVAANRWRTRAAALLPIALGLALSAAVIPHDHQRMTFDPVAQQLVCTDDAPQVCVSRVHAGLLDEVTPHARQALSLLAKLPDPPTRAQENTNTYLDEKTIVRYGADTVAFDLDVDSDGHLKDTDTMLIRMLDAGGASAVGCPDGFDVPVERAAGAWISGREPVRDPDDPEITAGPGDPNPLSFDAEAAQLWEKLRQLPEKEALARVVAVREAALECRDATGLLDGSNR
ncbi:hypothetical protein Ait01nite_034910 [Actinoplanes italicus]|uniref:ABC-type transport system involved in multi-copper enzyme maturation permease subunit n=1 Tax=Actinoplanes italicus TaxID=113567 RepID=A0A2T0K8Y9_9ACTN|nr:hypothetical protein [Actinoplanes italicus]PRX19540.1 hypothetical protein CLV67_110292 [Actinoplanes italicus]GIE30446.1 hypothetical protein Ait01nite_034910 [Actinoplanes italicus]